MVNILSNGVDFLSIARGSFQGNGIGLSARSRELTKEFFSNSTALFNSLYLQTEDAEANLALQIRALRSRLGIDSADVVALSQTRGQTVNTQA
jgi:hypothetical protein